MHASQEENLEERFCLSAAVPADVRWRLCPTVRRLNNSGLCPNLVLKPQEPGGVAPKILDLPHIKWQSHATKNSESNQLFDSLSRKPT
jgi:hypothetical protein